MADIYQLQFLTLHKIPTDLTWVPLGRKPRTELSHNCVLFSVSEKGGHESPLASSDIPVAGITKTRIKFLFIFTGRRVLHL